MSIEILAREVLAQDPGVLGLVQSGGVVRIYPMLLPPNPTLPAITYRGISKVTAYNFEDPDMVQCRIQVDAWATTYAAVKALGKAIRDAFHRYPGTDGGIQDFEAVNEQDLFEDVTDATGTRRLHRVRSDFFAYARDAAA